MPIRQNRLPRNGRSFPAGQYFPRNGKEGKECRFTVTEKGKQNTDSPNGKCKREKVDVLSVLRNRQIFKNLINLEAAVHYSEWEVKELNLDLYKNVDIVNSETLQNGWREQMNVSQSYDGYRQELLELPQKFEHMCDWRIGLIEIAKHRMELL